MLWFWVIVLVVLIGAIAVVASGRGDAMAEVYDDRPDVALPTGRPLSAEDLRNLRLNTGVRGYRMDEVDALLARLEAEMIEREESPADQGPAAAVAQAAAPDPGAAAPDPATAPDAAGASAAFSPPAEREGDEP